MRIFLRVLFLIAFTCLSIHLLRLSYEKWLQPTASVLDKYENSVETEIREAASLEDLEALYEEAHAEVEAKKNETGTDPPESPDWSDQEPFKSERQLRTAIQAWENQAREIHKVRTYWAFGVIFLVIGLIATRYSRQWLAIASLIVAFSEMIYWSSPSYFGGRTSEVERLLTNKLGLVAVSFILLLLVGHRLRILAPEERDI